MKRKFRKFKVREWDELCFSPGQIGKMADLTDRQIGEWKKRGFLPKTRGSEDDDPKWKWSEMKWRQVFVVYIIATLHNEFGIPLVRLKSLFDWLKDEHEVLKLIEMYNTECDVFLVTDLQKYFCVGDGTELSSSNGSDEKRIVIRLNKFLAKVSRRLVRLELLMEVEDDD